MSDAEVERILQKHEVSLLAIDGVEGIGIQTDAMGNPVIMVYLRDTGVASRIPTQVDGVAIKTTISGKFEAQ
ncbi:MAG: hypothetical protein U0350_39625 [Caldilineaceae bacterium]